MSVHVWQGILGAASVVTTALPSVLKGSMRGPYRLSWRGAVRAVNATLTILLLIVLLLMAAGTVPALWGWRSYTVMSGSMAPTIPTGSMVVTKPVAIEALKVGDIISFAKRTQQDAVITHRVVDITTSADGKPQISTKGDNNPHADTWIVNSQNQVSKMVYFVPLAGYVVSIASTSEAQVALIVAIVILFIVQSRWGRRKKAPDSTPPA